MGPAEGNASEYVLRSSERLVMARAVDAGKDFDRAVVGPALPLPIALIVPVVNLDFNNPFDVLNAVEAGHDVTQREAMCFGQFFAVHQIGQHDIAPNAAGEGNAVAISYGCPQSSIHRAFLFH